jgi:hypothetical protein
VPQVIGQLSPVRTSATAFHDLRIRFEILVLPGRTSELRQSGLVGPRDRIWVMLSVVINPDRAEVLVAQLANLLWRDAIAFFADGIARLREPVTGLLGGVRVGQNKLPFFARAFTGVKRDTQIPQGDALAFGICRVFQGQNPGSNPGLAGKSSS